MIPGGQVARTDTTPRPLHRSTRIQHDPRLYHPPPTTVASSPMERPVSSFAPLAPTRPASPRVPHGRLAYRRLLRQRSARPGTLWHSFPSKNTLARDRVEARAIGPRRRLTSLSETRVGPPRSEKYRYSLANEFCGVEFERADRFWRFTSFDPDGSVDPSSRADGIDRFDLLPISRIAIPDSAVAAFHLTVNNSAISVNRVILLRKWQRGRFVPRTIFSRSSSRGRWEAKVSETSGTASFRRSGVTVTSSEAISDFDARTAVATADIAWPD